MTKRTLISLLVGLIACTSGLLSSHTSQAIEVAFENDSNLPLVYINVAIKAGSVTDPQGQTGLTNFMGEMLLRGTRLHSKEQIDLALDQMGAKLDVETRAEALIFRGAVLSSQLEPYLNLFTEILTQPSFSNEEIKKFKSEQISVLQEALGHDPSLASLKFQEFLFRDHAYGKPVEGKIKDINAFTHTQLLNHYNLLMQDRMLLIVGSGATTSERVSAWATELSKKKPNIHLDPYTERLLTRVPSPENADQRRLLIIDKPDRTQTQINAGQIGIRMTDSHFFPLYLGNYAFGGPSFSAILMDEIRVKRGWSYGANSSFRHGLQPRYWNFHLFPAAKDAANALAYSIKLTEDLKEHGISNELYGFAQRSLVNSSGFIYNTPKKRVENKLLELTLNLPEGFMKSFGSELQKVSLADVNSSLNHFLKPNQMAITVLGTAKELKESLAKAAGVPIDQVKVIPYTQE